MAEVLEGTEGFRTFINLGTSACTSGCSYCYVPAGHSKPFDWREIELALSRFLESDSFVPGKNGTILTFGGQTDLFRSPALVDLLFRALARVCAFGNPVQISTKQFVPEKWTAALRAGEWFAGQITLFVSCSSISSANSVERSAAPPAKRWETFSSLRAAGLTRALLIKPWLDDATRRDLPLFADLAVKFALDAVCLGALYVTPRILGKLNALNLLGQHLGKAAAHPLISEPHFSIAPAAGVVTDFRARLHPTPLFESSVCVSAAFARVPCPLHAAGPCNVGTDKER